VMGSAYYDWLRRWHLSVGRRSGRVSDRVSCGTLERTVTYVINLSTRVYVALHAYYM
jgi:hypothetical protein